MNPKAGESSITEGLHRSLHYHPDSYWCADCHRFTLDCSHLVEPLQAPSVTMSDAYTRAAYDRGRRILEVTDNCGHAHQFFGVPRGLAVAFVKAEDPRAYFREHISGKYGFERVRRLNGESRA